MTTIHDAYVNALLADAAYVDGFVPGETGAALTQIVKGRMTPDLAKYIGDNLKQKMGSESFLISEMPFAN